MKYGKNQVSRKRDKLHSSKSKIGKGFAVSALRALFFTLLAVIAIGICGGVGMLRGLIDSAPDIADVNIMPSGYASFVYDSEGNEIQKLVGKEGNRISVSIDQIPEDMQHAIVAIEDERFYEHNGVDPRGILRAFVVGVKNKFRFTEGASTLTQQLLKNNVFTNWTNEGKVERFKRKFQEQYLALKLEASLKAEGKDAKSIILENYLNTVNFGAGAYGIQSAALTYFGKNSSELTLSECAVLAAIPQNPTMWNPIRHPDKNAERRAKVLLKMKEQGYITEEEYNEALNDNVYDRIAENTASTPEAEPYSYFVDETIQQVKQDLMTQKGYTSVQASNAIYSGGYKIYTTMDSEIQQIMDEEYQNPDNFPSNTEVGLDWALSVQKLDGTTKNYSQEMLQSHFRETDASFDLRFSSEEEAQSYVDQYKASVVQEGETIIAERISFSPQPQSSMVIMDQSTGYVKGIVGGRGKKTASLTLNRATDTYRQPGSTFKILSTYGPALDMGEITLATIVDDEQYFYETGKEVKNSNGSHLGPISIRTAIIKSNNVVAVKTLTEITPQSGFDYLAKFGFSKLVASTGKDIRQPLALGGITNGVSNLELTSAFAAIANGGTYIEPIFYEKVVDSDGNVILDNTTTKDETVVFKESTSYLLTSAMEDVVKQGTGTAFRLNNMPVAGKTGTTNTYKDLVFVGYTPYYTCGIWAGYDDPAELPKSSRNFYKTLWTSVMNRVHKDLPRVEFEVPDSVEKATICASSGLLAGVGCPRTTEYFESSQIPTKRCRAHYIPPTPTPTPTPSVTPGTTPSPTPTPTTPPDNPETGEDGNNSPEPSVPSPPAPDTN